MPKRPRSHQLEDLSKTELRRLLPPAWVVREKSHDYGIDFEIEIFESDSSATGLLFYVQLRATDNIAASKYVILKAEQTAYFSQLDVPTLLIRYCSANHSFFWKWHTQLPSVKRNRQSVKVHFYPKDSWVADSADNIVGSLKYWRAIKAHPDHMPVPVAISIADLAPRLRLPFRRLVNEVVRETAALRVTDAEPGSGLILAILGKSTGIRISVGTNLWLEVGCSHDTDSMKTTLRYMLASVLFRSSLRVHAELLARQCLAAEQPTLALELAYIACCALRSRPMAAVELAVLNGIHKFSPELAQLFVVFINSQSAVLSEKKDAIDHFLTNMLREAEAKSNAKSLGYAQYIMAGRSIADGNFRKALVCFNRARRVWSNFGSQPRFLQLVGMSLFNERRFNLSSAVYERVLSVDPSQRLSLYLGDSYFFSARFENARVAYADAIQGDDLAVIAEARVKADMISWMIANFGQCYERRRADLLLIKERRHEEFGVELAIIVNFDPLDFIAHWNVGRHFVLEKCFREALPHLLICAFRNPRDQSAWTIALKCATASGDVMALQAVLSCALALGGPDVADDFCATFTENDEAMGAMTSLIVELVAGLYKGRDSEASTYVLSNRIAFLDDIRRLRDWVT